ncbi:MULTISPECIES: Lrp/AsnC family transcriptional regulator [unclassified Bartonella]|uniref:Lrp/AsnC family transcriptional regulator n=1 Tax=unclassified Bartonella TaxID=2645622 RepID=UPI0015FC5B53|nr:MULTISPECIES: Lrp/AsnC family transcriptional regulator [unclassified Bartonella]UXM95210.1 Lrp/AsnC family transcriptional regulator [Bartonella sp. HY329]UXN06295.1 Lrp/AsnC family transcriptional regulator [Bartonella sp. HY761]UXN09533.1 Lrp/AsnC family transcriptional regulator [Bartonella sp. HY328]
MFHLDAIDRNIIRALRRDGRMTNARIAQEVGLSASACLRRVQILEETGVIRGYTAIIGEVGNDEGLNIIVQITLERQSEEFLQKFENAVRRHPEIKECYLMAGSADYWLRAEAENAAAYEIIHKQILSRLPGVMHIQSSFSIRSVLTQRQSSQY